MRHKWSKDDPDPGYSTCTRCDMTVKTYRIKKGRVPPCDPPPEPPLPTPVCLETGNLSILSCAECPGRFKDKLCDKMRKNYRERK